MRWCSKRGPFTAWAHAGIPIDTLGAGDSLIGRFLAGVGAGETTPEALEAASKAAAKTCGHNGAFGHVHHYGTDGANGGSAWPVFPDSQALAGGAAKYAVPSKGVSATRPVSSSGAWRRR